MTDTAASAMQQLRGSTREEHERAEHHQFQQALIRGELPRQRYEAWLGQMYLVHQSLEGALRAAADHSDAIAAVVHEYQYQVPYLVEDLRHFGVDPGSVVPLPSTKRFAAMVEAHLDDPFHLLGLHYVLEGSNNGGRFIARHVAQAYELSPGVGLRYLDPYGDRQREYWLAFRETMDALDFSPEQSAGLVAAAKQMYQAVAELADDLAAAG